VPASAPVSAGLSFERLSPVTVGDMCLFWGGRKKLWDTASNSLAGIACKRVFL
jgi:hypothetical protein